MQLTPEQAQVLEHQEGLLLVQARAGSGKTTTTCLHAKKLVDAGVKPKQILVTTFSKQGANDMREKGESLGLPWGIQFKTLHSEAYRAMREGRSAACQMRDEAHQPKEFLIIDGGKRWKLNHILKRELESKARRFGIAVDAKKRPAGLSVGDVRNFIAAAKASLIAPNPYTVQRHVFYEPGDEVPGMETWAKTELGLEPGPAKLVAAVYEAYEKAKRDPYRYDREKFRSDEGKQYLTFDDMIFHIARGVLLGSSWVEPFRGRYRWVFVDEVQDNSLGQWVIARHLADDRNLVAIGDDMQSIYAFRGAVPELMRRYLDEAGATMLTLTKNFRSRAEIIDAANKVLLAAEDGLSDAVMEPGLPDAHHAADIGLRGYTDPHEEADLVVDDIATQIEKGTTPCDIAVLYRTNAQSGPLEIALLKAGIRYRIAGSSFFSRAEVRTAINYLRLALDDTDIGAYERVYALPLRGLGRAFLNAYPTYPALLEAYHAGSLERRFKRGARELVEHIENIQGRLAEGNNGLARALRYIAEDVGVRGHYRDEDAPEDDITTVDESMNALIDCGENLQDVDRLVAYARDMSGTRVEDGEGTERTRQMVTLSTVHRSKGLEWPTVYVTGLTRNVFPHMMADPAEEMRLVYVALTRAKTALRVSYTAYRQNEAPGGPSPAIGLIGLMTYAQDRASSHAREGAEIDDAIPLA